VVAKSGRAYRIAFLDGGKRKELIATPIHLMPADVGKADA
jgi:ribosomal protein L21E